MRGYAKTLRLIQKFKSSHAKSVIEWGRGLNKLYFWYYVIKLRCQMLQINIKRHTIFLRDLLPRFLEKIFRSYPSYTFRDVYRHPSINLAISTNSPRNSSNHFSRDVKTKLYGTYSRKSSATTFSNFHRVYSEIFPIHYSRICSRAFAINSSTDLSSIYSCRFFQGNPQSLLHCFFLKKYEKRCSGISCKNSSRVDQLEITLPTFDFPTNIFSFVKLLQAVLPLCR